MANVYHPSIEGAQHGAKPLADFLAYAKRSGASDAQPSNYMIEGKSAAEIRSAFEKEGLLIDGVSAHCPIWVESSGSDFVLPLERSKTASPVDIGTHPEIRAEFPTGRNVLAEKPRIDVPQGGEMGFMHCRRAARGIRCSRVKSTRRRASANRSGTPGTSAFQKGVDQLPKTKALPSNPLGRIIRIFAVYAHEDRSKMLWMRLLVELATEQLRTAGISIEVHFWADDRLRAGDQWEPEIERELLGADIIIEMLSFNFLRSKFIRQFEHPRALKRVRAGEASLFAVILERCPWTVLELEPWQVAPPEGRPITDYARASDGWNDVHHMFLALMKEVLLRKTSQKTRAA
ncbi:MAG TPA: TIR domain-containing protein [Chthoniobacteraceae bacterium]|jgi:hypothetical protein|nr:TIR domain-containing protein [Chthoniobacteraceae bacterium]